MSKQKGVTLIELLIVIVVLGIIASFSIPASAQLIRNVKVGKIFNELVVIETGARYYFYDVGERPRGSLSGAGTCATWNADSIEVFIEGERDGIPIEGWSGPYMNDWDDETPLGGCYVYRNYEVGSQNWARSNWYRFIDDVQLDNIAPTNKDIELIMIRFYPLNDQATIDKALEVAEQLLGKVPEEQLFYVDGQAVIGYYILPQTD
ncbi:MAG: prepilin-type N-terminal cleavage/methylation domain-containing protein [Candidatus Izemoplasma sp.]|nr:prepilin-type N-terminal cleavage/methylation domain-containing protein [Candidatus Izemoplasma sp.]